MIFKRIIAIAMLACLGLFSLASAQSLGAASTFAILAGAGVTNTGPSIISGDVGVFPGSAITGFPPGTVVNGSFHVTDGPAAQAQADLAVAYTAIQNMPVDTVLTGQDLGGKTLPPGVYHFDTSAQLTGVLTLDAGGDPNAKWYFQIGSTLTTASNSAVIVIGGGSANNVFWQVGSSATIGTGTAFGGHILAFASITFQTGSTLGLGSALAQTGAVTLDTNIISATVAAVLTPLISTNPPAGGTLAFGDICLGEDKTLVLDIANVGDGPLTISNIAPNGSGVTLKSPVLPFDLAPNAHAFIDVTVTPTGIGPHMGSVVVTSNSGGNPGTTTTVNVSSNTPTGTLALLPASLDFGPVCLNDATTRDVEVYNIGNCDLTLVFVGDPANPAYTVIAPPISVNIQPGDHATVPVTFTPTAPGTVSSSFVITTDNGGGLQNTVYPVTGQGVTPTIAASPTTLDFGNVCPGVPVHQFIQIRNTGGCPATVNSIMKVGGVNPASITLSNPTLPATLPAGGTLLIDVAVNAQVTTGAISTTVRTNINDSVVNTDVAVTATVASGTLGLSPTALSFGNVCVGASSSKIVTLRNTGACDLSVSNVAITAGGGVYTIEPVTTPVVIAPNSSAPVTVVFTPTATGNGQAGVLTVTSNSGGAVAAMSNVPLTGDSAPGVIGVSPAALDFGNVCAGSTKSKVLTIRNTGDCDLAVSNIAITAGSTVYSIEPITTPLIIPHNGSVPVTVVFAPAAVGSGQAGMLTVTSDSGGAVAATTNVPLTGNAPAGVLAANPTALDFGSLCAGVSMTKSLQLRNTGGCDLTVTAATLTGAGAASYSLPADLILPLTLNPGGSITTQVTLAANAPSGANNAMLTFATADANTLVVALSSNVSAVPTVSVSGVSGAQSGAGTAADPYVVCVGALPAFTFTVAGADADGGNTVRLTQSGVPNGANYTNVLPATGNPVTTTVSLTPSPAQGGQSYAMTFTATDDSAATCSASVTLHLRVSSLPVISATPSALTVCEGMPIAFRVRATDADPGSVTIGAPTVTHTGGQGTPALNLVSTPGLPTSGNPAETSVTGTAPDVSADTTYTLTYTATDSDGCTATQVVTVTVMDSMPSTLTMTRSPSGEISVGQQVCYTAVVRDNCSEPRLAPGVPVCFTVVSTTGNNTVAAGVHVTTDANGAALYCLTPNFPGTVTVTAVIDFDGDCVADTGTTGATLNLTVQAPAPNNTGIYITGQGKVDATDPVFGTAPAIAQFSLDISPKPNGSFKGKVNVLIPSAGTLSNGKRTSVKINSTRIDSVTMTDTPDGHAAVIFGMVKVSGMNVAGLNGTRPFRLDALDAGTPGIPNDTFILTFLDTVAGMTVGPLGGHLGFGRGATSPKDDIKIRSGIRGH